MSRADGCTRVHNPQYPLRHLHELARRTDAQAGHDDDAGGTGDALDSGARPQIKQHAQRLELKDAAANGDEVRLRIDAPLSPARKKAHALLMASRCLAREDIVALAQTGSDMHALLAEPGPGIAAPVLLACSDMRRARAAYQVLARVYRDPAALGNARRHLWSDGRMGLAGVLGFAAVTAVGAWGTAALEGDWQAVCEALLGAGGALTVSAGACAAVSCRERRRLRNPEIGPALAAHEETTHAFDVALRRWLGIAREGQLTRETMQRWLAACGPVAEAATPQVAIHLASQE